MRKTKKNLEITKRSNHNTLPVHNKHKNRIIKDDNKKPFVKKTLVSRRLILDFNIPLRVEG